MSDFGPGCAARVPAGGVPCLMRVVHAAAGCHENQENNPEPCPRGAGADHSGESSLVEEFIG